jgi:hypothetical protein
MTENDDNAPEGYDPACAGGCGTTDYKRTWKWASREEKKWWCRNCGAQARAHLLAGDAPLSFRAHR